MSLIPYLRSFLPLNNTLNQLQISANDFDEENSFGNISNVDLQVLINNFGNLKHSDQNKVICYCEHLQKTDSERFKSMCNFINSKLESFDLELQNAPSSEIEISTIMTRLNSRPMVNLKNLNDAELTMYIQRFGELQKSEQEQLMNYLKEIGRSDPKRIETLRQIIKPLRSEAENDIINLMRAYEEREKLKRIMHKLMPEANVQGTSGTDYDTVVLQVAFKQSNKRKFDTVLSEANIEELTEEDFRNKLQLLSENEACKHFQKSGTFPILLPAPGNESGSVLSEENNPGSFLLPLSKRNSQENNSRSFLLPLPGQEPQKSLEKNKLVSFLQPLPEAKPQQASGNTPPSFLLPLPQPLAVPESGSFLLPLPAADAPQVLQNAGNNSTFLHPLRTCESSQDKNGQKIGTCVLPAPLRSLQQPQSNSFPLTAPNFVESSTNTNLGLLPVSPQINSFSLVTSNFSVSSPITVTAARGCKIQPVPLPVPAPEASQVTENSQIYPFLFPHPPVDGSKNFTNQISPILLPVPPPDTSQVVAFPQPVPPPEIGKSSFPMLVSQPETVRTTPEAVRTLEHDQVNPVPPSEVVESNECDSVSDQLKTTEDADQSLVPKSPTIPEVSVASNQSVQNATDVPESKGKAAIKKPARRRKHKPLETLRENLRNGHAMNNTSLRKLLNYFIYLPEKEQVKLLLIINELQQSDPQRAEVLRGVLNYRIENPAPFPTLSPPLVNVALKASQCTTSPPIKKKLVKKDTKTLGPEQNCSPFAFSAPIFASPAAAAAAVAVFRAQVSATPSVPVARVPKSSDNTEKPSCPEGAKTDSKIKKRGQFDRLRVRLEAGDKNFTMKNLQMLISKFFLLKPEPQQLLIDILKEIDETDPEQIKNIAIYIKLRGQLQYNPPTELNSSIIDMLVKRKKNSDGSTQDVDCQEVPQQPAAESGCKRSLEVGCSENTLESSKKKMKSGPSEQVKPTVGPGSSLNSLSKEIKYMLQKKITATTDPSSRSNAVSVPDGTSQEQVSWIFVENRKALNNGTPSLTRRYIQNLLFHFNVLNPEEQRKLIQLFSVKSVSDMYKWLFKFVEVVCKMQTETNDSPFKSLVVYECSSDSDCQIQSDSESNKTTQAKKDTSEIYSPFDTNSCDGTTEELQEPPQSTSQVGSSYLSSSGKIDPKLLIGRRNICQEFNDWYKSRHGNKTSNHSASSSCTPKSEYNPEDSGKKPLKSCLKKPKTEQSNQPPINATNTFQQNQKKNPPSTHENYTNKTKNTATKSSKKNSQPSPSTNYASRKTYNQPTKSSEKNSGYSSNTSHSSQSKFKKTSQNIKPLEKSYTYQPSISKGKCYITYLPSPQYKIPNIGKEDVKKRKYRKELVPENEKEMHDIVEEKPVKVTKEMPKKESVPEAVMCGYDPLLEFI